MLSIIDKNITRSIKKFGQTVKWYPSRLCSCVGKDGVPQLNHTCNMGFYYDDPEVIKAIRTQVSYKYLNTPYGRIYNGGATFTIPKFVNVTEQNAWYKIAHGDVLVLDNKTRRETDVLYRGVRDYLYAFDVTEILSVYSNNIKYIEGIDFNVYTNPMEFEDNEPMQFEDDILMEFENSGIGAKNLLHIDWLPGKGPEEREYYSVEFVSKQQYKVWEDGGQDRGTDDDELPKKVVCVMRRFVNPEYQPLDNVDIKQEVY
jgi:hypothetical protein